MTFNAGSDAAGVREMEGLTVQRDDRGPGGPAMAAAEAAPAAGDVSSQTPASVVASRQPAGSAPRTSSSSPVTATGAPSGGGTALQGSPGTPRLTGGGSGKAQRAPRPAADLVAPPNPGSGSPGQNLGDTTQVITDELGRVVDRIDPRLGETVQGVGQGVGQLVGGLTGQKPGQGLGQGVGRLVDGLTGTR